ncbi:MAG: hypothetical protein IPI73_31065 [Betaproteobacteria bacterium]|nr:hypothetical protein [Betaproteobacteria bacterium]
MITSPEQGRSVPAADIVAAQSKLTAATAQSSPTRCRCSTPVADHELFGDELVPGALAAPRSAM